MQPQDGLEITVFIPAFLIPVIVLLLIGVIGGAGVAAWRHRQRQQRRADELRAAKAAELAGGPHEANPTTDAYRNFIRDISHEISNPLQSIQTNLDNMALCSPEEAGRWRQYHGSIAGEVSRLARLTNQLRLLALLETPNAPQVREPVNMKAVIEDVIMALAEEGEQRHVRLSYVGPQRPARVLGNRDQLRQVLLNLVDNGIKYAGVAGGAVVFNVQEQGARLQVRVSDDGVGIPPEVLEHIGEDGYRVSNPGSFRRKGSGFGLALAKRIIRQHGGDLRIQSQPGEGTTVSFDLPIYDSGKVSP
jgi:two-component system phosphate regulon sensor histidine kinase PhoR